MATTGAELVQAEAELWCHNFGYLKSMALRCAIKLGIPNAIHRCGGAASLPELHAAIPVAASKRPCLSRIMTFLATSGIFREQIPEDGAAEPCYHLTTASRLLVDDETRGGRTCVSQLLTLCSSPFYFTASQNLAEWLQKEDGDAAAARTPFTMAHGAGFYDVVCRDAAFGVCFDDAMGSDSCFVSEIVIREYGEVFAGVTSLVDVGGHNGTTARAIAKAFPHMRCSVLDLPRVVDAMPTDGTDEVKGRGKGNEKNRRGRQQDSRRSKALQ
ncbi:Trans-resveratrol di-O-methyltransferase [Dichanthelium oligosanthes]|uniref:Trans-resveratrol di-O-methyltransferase n=1 Tax=Dichanthelium oligosanthes TaxID=888268 RepID=A0A1E5W9T1_9POAL|nr:Trans-resveratrol di-O-methyltransferase [Dichanthelium oligosanthes]